MRPIVDDVPFDLPQEQASDLAIEKSEPFLGRWNRLVSSTNWEKGAIIVAWRTELQNQLEPVSALSDEAWSRLAGGVSPQHVGRLRRTCERFGTVWQSYSGLYWSHFYATLDWHDAEMWLEGAVQNGWSVSRMRLQRWEVTGAVPEEHPGRAGNQIVESELAEESSSLTAESGKRDPKARFSSEPLDEGPDFGEGPAATSRTGAGDHVLEMADVPKLSAQALFEKFENLPEDVSEAVEAMKLCIIRHRADEWSEISQAQLVDVLGALRTLAASQADAHGAE